MASPDEIARLRRLINEPEDAAPYTNQYLESLIDAANGDVTVAAYNVWTDKTAEFSTLVDISEGGSSRKQSQAFTNAQAMAAHFRSLIGGVDDGARVSRTRKVDRI